MHFCCAVTELPAKLLTAVNFWPNPFMLLQRRSSIGRQQLTRGQLWTTLFYSSILLIAIQAQTNSEIPDHRTLHPLSPDSPVRRETAASEPTYNLTLHYGLSGGEPQDSQYLATVEWHLRHKALVVLDNPIIRSMHCTADGISLEFNSTEARRRAEEWELPLILITEGSNGDCAYDLEGHEEYHPITLDSLLRLDSDSDQIMSFSGYRSRWDMVGHDYQVQLEHHTNSPNSLQRRRLRDAPEFDFNPSINYNVTTKEAKESEIPLTVWEEDNHSVEITLRDSYFHARVHLILETGSRIINVGINSSIKIVLSLSKAERKLKESLRTVARSSKQSTLRWFTILSRELSDAFSQFIQKLSEYTQNPPTDEAESLKVKESIRQAALATKHKAQKLTAVAEGELYVSINDGLSPETKLQVLGLVKETVRITEDEIESSIKTLTNASISEADVCSEENFKPVHGNLTPRSWISLDTLRSHRFAFCRRGRRRMNARITGRMKARVDLKVDVKGRVEFELGNIPVISAGLTGLSIPNIITIGPEVRLVTSSTIAFQGTASTTFGADIEWERMDTTIDAHADPSLSSSSPIKPFITLHKPSFNIEPVELSVVQDLKPQFNFGIMLEVVNLEASIGVGARIGLENSFKFGLGLDGSEVDGCPDGMKYVVRLKAALEALVNVPTKRSWLGLPSGLFPPKTVFTLLEMKPLNLFNHCFKTPSFCRSSKANQTISTCVNRISSDEL
ncbi:uncharacterized protein MELLADRAFT_101848 [Melampsora larici-populina 98AG31]|uniref:DUF7223 domain-containing protein n=1 Tax=Melampsora larici-populina (strain 98AG31 / pathotype 3-4-7) TaxID=747676 RepID=F4R537_MELLP|nr:uncharacterized protein MELLADRAFT_101848 [Melampsora larici-populina 98AG31]EGG12338.1 hypothetical protein MELLADRAFT_101848 [Melampsora larici-populina 98AG31]